MKFPTFLHILFVYLVFSTSCSISINENGYRFLTEKEKVNFKPFSIDVLKKTYNYKDSIRIFEINSEDIKEISKHHKFTWVVLWAPYCSSKECTIMPEIMCDMKEKYKTQDVQTILISNSYNLKELKKVISHSNSNCPIFVLQNLTYGQKQGIALKRFAKELDNNSMFNEKDFADNFIFKDTLLIESFWKYDNSKIDSIFMNK